tara:strand:- start:381 stop:926 length:546 start_codon:yes stop_codon:yes gene_type:complete
MVVVTVPFAKAPKEEMGAVEFSYLLQDLLMHADPMTVMLYGDKHKDIVNIETAQGKNDPLVRVYYETLKSHKLHLDIRSFEADDELLKDNDVVIGHLPFSSNLPMLEGLQNLIDEYSIVSISDLEYANHRLSLVSLELFDTESIIIYLNEGSVDLYSRLAEDLAEYCLLYEGRSSPSDDSQ